jgi:hypothetical protein
VAADLLRGVLVRVVVTVRVMSARNRDRRERAE